VIGEHVEFRRLKYLIVMENFSKHYKTQNDTIHSFLCNRIPCLPGML